MAVYQRKLGKQAVERLTMRQFEDAFEVLLLAAEDIDGSMRYCSASTAPQLGFLS